MPINFIHNIAGAPNVAIIVDGKQILNSVAYKDISPYFDFEGKISVVVSIGSTVILSKTLKVTGQGTLIITGLNTDTKSVQGQYYEERCPACPKYGNIKFRFIHAAAGVPNVDVFTGSTRLFSDVTYDESSKYLEVPAGVINVAVTLANTLNVAVGPLNLFIPAGTVCSIIASGLPGNANSPLTALIAIEQQPYGPDGCDKLKKNLNVEKYLGKWYQIAAIPQPFATGCERSTAEYSTTSNPNVLTVFNTCYSVSGKEWIVNRTITGTATITLPKAPSALLVQFPNIPNPNVPNYLIHQTNYEYALVGSPDRSNLYVLYREKKMARDMYDKLMDDARKLGYNIDNVVIDKHAVY